MRTLVAGWFSFANGHATAGDLLACDVVCEWLKRAGYTFDVALAPPFRGGVDLHRADPAGYSHAVFVCGPFEKKELEAQFLGRFANCIVFGVDLTMHVPLDAWNPFDFLIERDSSAAAHPDITFLSAQRRVPVVGLCLVEPYEGSIASVANAAFDRLIASREMAVVQIDTRLDVNTTGLRSPAEVESLLARMDVVLTTRLHGTVLALKNGVPVVAIDPEAGGAKIKRQAQTIGWPAAFAADAVSDESLQEAFEYCLTGQARAAARECCDRAASMVEKMRLEFIAALDHSDQLVRKQGERAAFAASYSHNRHADGTNAERAARVREPLTGGRMLKRLAARGRSLLSWKR